MKIQLCKRCGSKRDVKLLFTTPVRDNQKYRVICRACDLYGPYGKNKDEAKKKWNDAELSE